MKNKNNRIQLNSFVNFDGTKALNYFSTVARKTMMESNRQRDLCKIIDRQCTIYENVNKRRTHKKRTGYSRKETSKDKGRFNEKVQNCEMMKNKDLQKTNK